MTGAAAERASLVVEQFETFYLREYRGVVKLALALSHSRLVAEDIAQDAFLAAYRLDLGGFAPRKGGHP